MKRPISLLLTLLAVLACASTILAQDSLNVTQRTMVTLSWGEASRVAIQGNYAYIASGKTGLRILDISDPDDPAEIGYCDTPGEANGVAVSGNYAYVADMMCDLRVIDISNPSHPHEIAWLETGTMAYDVDCDENFVYLVDRWDGLKIIDISNPYQPTIVGAWTSSMSNVLCVTIAGSSAYVGCGSQGLVVVDIREPNSPAFLASIQTPSVPVDVFVSGDLAYVIASGLRILDVSEPADPHLFSVTDVTGGARAVVAEQNYAYVPTYSNGVRILDVSSPSSPFEVSDFPADGPGEDIALVGDFACVVDNGVRIADISNPASPNIVSTFVSRGENQRVTLSGNHIYVAAGCGGLKIIEITSSELLEVVGNFHPSSPNDVSVVGNYAYVADEAQGLTVIDVENPESPVLIGSCVTPGNTKAVEVSGIYAYLADYDGGFRVVDVADPSAPTEVASCPTIGSAKDIAVQGNYAYVIDNALRVFDITDPNNPLLIGGYSSLESYNGIAVSGIHAYVTYLFDISNGIFGLRVFDISNPREPVPCGSIVTPGGEYAYSMKVEGDYLYLANGIGGLQVYDVSDPYNLVMAGFYTPSHTEAKALDMHSGRVYMVDKHFLRVLDYLPVTAVDSPTPMEVPADFGISSAYPNPFNPSTNITFHLAKAAHISLIVYDVQGRQVAVLADGRYPAGIHHRLFDASGLSSGIYFAIMTSSNFRQMEKLVLLK
jgi:hypothetical protein